jgi:hypothetical protein
VTSDAQQCSASCSEHPKCGSRQQCHCIGNVLIRRAGFSVDDSNCSADAATAPEVGSPVKGQPQSPHKPAVLCTPGAGLLCIMSSPALAQLLWLCTQQSEVAAPANLYISGEHCNVRHCLAMQRLCVANLLLPVSHAVTCCHAFRAPCLCSIKRQSIWQYAQA